MDEVVDHDMCMENIRSLRNKQTAEDSRGHHHYTIMNATPSYLNAFESIILDSTSIYKNVSCGVVVVRKNM